MSFSPLRSAGWSLMWLWLPLVVGSSALVLLPALWGAVVTFAAHGGGLVVLARNTPRQRDRPWTYGYVLVCWCVAIGLAVFGVLRST